MTAVAAPPRRVEPQPSLSEHVIGLAAPKTAVSQGTTVAFALSRAPVMSVPSRVIGSSWFGPTLAQFEAAVSLPRGWDSYEGIPVSFSVVERAMSFLGSYLAQQSIPPTVVPLSDGGVQLVWHENGLDVEASFPAVDPSEVYIRDLATDDEYEFNPAHVVEGIDRLREAFQRLSA